MAAALALGFGAAIPLLAALFAPGWSRLPIVFAAAIVGLCITSAVVVRAGTATVARTFARALTIGVLTMPTGLAVGPLLD